MDNRRTGTHSYHHGREVMPRTAHDLLPGDTAHQYHPLDMPERRAPEQFGVQPHSQGPIYPAVIARVESYYDPQEKGHLQGVPAYGSEHDFVLRHRSTSYVLMLDGIKEAYSSYDDAHEVARALIASPFLRAQWQQGREFDTAESL